jgi:bacillithiol biosynthesis deacetylase BshB1
MSDGTVTVDVLALAAHPDDAEVGCGGVLLRSMDWGRRVGVIDLTRGEAATRGDPETRRRERDRATKLLGLAVRTGLDLPDGALGTEPEHRLAVVRAIRELRPEVVLAPYPEDRHPDHAAAGRLAREAAFLASVAGVGEGPAHRPRALFHYMLHHQFDPSFVVDVSDVWDRKMEAVAAYESQFGTGPGPATALAGGRFLELLEARATVHGAMVGVRRAEAYRAAGPIGLSDLPVLGTEPPTYRMF